MSLVDVRLVGMWVDEVGCVGWESERNRVSVSGLVDDLRVVTFE